MYVVAFRNVSTLLILLLSVTPSSGRCSRNVSKPRLTSFTRFLSLSFRLAMEAHLLFDSPAYAKSILLLHLTASADRVRRFMGFLLSDVPGLFRRQATVRGVWH